MNPHFLYNTLDTIRIQAQLNGDEQVASLLMRLVSFFRRSVKVDRPQVRLEEELELIEAYLDLMCVRYPALDCAIDVAPELLDAQVPNFILQPLVENSLLHGLKGKGYRGTLRVSAERQGEILEILVADSGTGFAAEKKQEMDEMLLHYDTWEPKLTGNSIGVLNVQKRIKLLCGKRYGLSYEGNELGGVTALSQMEELKPDIVVMDINIPLMNGLKVISLRRMRSETTAFVIVSGYDDFAYCREALKLQITDYLLKPVDYEEFGACIDPLRIALFEKGAARADTIGEGEKTIWSLTRYLQEHLSEEISLNLLADVFHLNPQYIGQLFKNEIGVNFLSYLTNIRMERAKKLLVSTDLPVSEVAQRSGYADYRVFTKAFKKAEGVTPSQYRQDF